MSQYIEKPVIITVKAAINPEAMGAFADWQGKLNGAIVCFPGFVSLEFLSPTDKNGTWMIVQRFNDTNSASSWTESPQKLLLFRELKELTVPKAIQEEAGTSAMHAGVTEVIVAQVNPDRLEEYRQWTAKIHQAEAKFPGFRGVYVQSPNSTSKNSWITLLQFDTQENLDRWLGSPERQEVLKESVPLITSLETHRVVSPFAGWFASIAKSGHVPAAWKQTMIVLLVLFPIVMFELRYLSPLLSGLDGSLATFISNAISVTLIAFPMGPIAIWFLRWWLSPGPFRPHLATIAGTAVVILLYLIEIFLFWGWLRH